MALITGSTKGIGAQLARRFAAEGASVVVTGRSKDAGERVADEIRTSGGTALFLAGDVSDPDAMKEASDATGLYDFGPDDFIEPMTRFMAAAVSEANLTPVGLASLPLDANRWLVNRLRVQEDITRHPEILDEDVSDPIVIVGVPRTGTTKLQRLLGCDPGLRTLPFWKILNPAPFPDASGQGTDPRVEIARQYAQVLQQNFPELMHLHPFVAEEPEEEVVMLEMTCRSVSSCLFFRVPTFFKWLTAQSQVPQYQYLRTLLQHQQWLEGGRRDRPWVLKSPMHLGRMDVTRCPVDRPKRPT